MSEAEEPTALAHGMRDTAGFHFGFSVTEEQAHALLEADAPSREFTLNGLRERAFYDDKGLFVYVVGEREDRTKTAHVDADLVRSMLADMIDQHRSDPVWIS